MDRYEDMFNPSFLKPKAKMIPPLPKNAAVTMAYVPYQQQAEPYSNEMEALCRGTLFEELDKPFTGMGALS
ncbi:MAG: spore coat associated protein CotJA [Clostridiales bacterium]|nr:spore coat associated protein CotJA [Clostridiales bacterium]